MKLPGIFASVATTLLPALASAQELKTQTMTVVDDHIPLYPVFYAIIFLGVPVIGVFLIYVLWRSIRERTYLQ